MLGVVLWSDTTDNKAVIWCEDHGELAYFNGEGGTAFEGVALDAGDLVQFEMEQASELRLARNMRRLEQGAYVGLPESLAEAAAPKKTPEKSAAEILSADILPFTGRRNARELVPA
ncbi:MAG: hypothetical protein GYB25_06490 [Rhodobacteraceae bacterium]|nr:hypothetical protein [Paracoccaceae bacterium]